MSVTVTKDMLVFNTDKYGIYKHPKEGYCLIEEGYARWMSARQAKALIKMTKDGAK